VAGVDGSAIEKIGCVRGVLADAYADSLLMAAGYSPLLPEAIYGVGVLTLVSLPSKESITAKADLVISGAESITIEVPDYFRVFYCERGWVRRRLDVIAALEIQAADPYRAVS
jgi:hypothetical protein